MRNGSNKFSSGVDVHLFHRERVLVVANHSKESKIGIFVKENHPQLSITPSLHLLREYFSRHWTLMCSRQYFRQGQRGQTRVSPHLSISPFRLPVPQRPKRVRFIGENVNNNARAAQNLWGKRWTALTFPSSHPVMTTLSVMGTRQLTASGWPENWSLCRPYWPLDREIARTHQKQFKRLWWSQYLLKR